MSHVNSGGISSSVSLAQKSKAYSFDPLNPAQFVRLFVPQKPTYLFDADNLKSQATRFLNSFPGDVAYAVKCNPTKRVLQTLTKSGISSYDVASLDEIKRVRKVAPNATLYFMNPVKTPESIRAAYHDYGVHIFVLDHKDELLKIIRETNLAQNLDLYIRVALPKNKSAQLDFSKKFGASFEQAVELLKMARPVAQKLGISFHVGTQSMDPTVYQRAIEYVRKIVDTAQINLDALDVGGGFPVTYQGQEPAPLEDYFDMIAQSLAENDFNDLHILCEPGRAMVAESMMLITRIELRRNDLLYINDGVYGGLVEMAPWSGLTLPHTLIPQTPTEEDYTNNLQTFRITGPTCDSLDMMNGPFVLPENVKMGDWILFYNMGAYSQSCRTDFNGFNDTDLILIRQIKA